MSKARERMELSKRMTKRFVRCDEGAALYSMSESKFSTLARKANAVYKVDRIVLINCDVFEDFLEKYRLKKGEDFEDELIADEEGGE